MSLLLAVIALRQRGVDFVRAEGIDTLVLEIDVCGRAESLFEGIGTYEWCGTVIFIHIEHRLGDVYPRVLAIEFLFRTFITEDVGKILGRQRLLSGRIEGRQWLVGHLGLDIVPLGRNLVLLKDKSFLFAHDSWIKKFGCKITQFRPNS